MNTDFDVIVLGLGAHGSSALYHLSKWGYNVCGIDQFTPPHSFGSSHGQSRIIRQAYHESPMYVPMVKEAYKLWNELEETSGEQLLLQTGGIMLGKADSAVITGSKLSAETHGVPYEYLQNEEIKKRFPAFITPEDTVAVAELNAGILFPEKCIAANLTGAKNKGAALFYNEAVTAIVRGNNCIEIVTNKSIYHTHKLIVSAGAWLNQLLPDLHLPLVIERQVLYWFKNNNALLQPYLAPNALPIYIWEYEPGKMFYGFPDLGDGIKVAPHHAGRSIEPQLLSQDVSEEEISSMKQITNQHINLAAQFNYATVCMYTNTPDEHFIIDVHPHNSNIIIASPCSGHGFKFSSLTGKILADMAMEKEVDFDIKPFRIGRFF